MSHTDLIAKHIAPLYPIPTGMTPGGALRKPVTAVLFDVYGTLFVSRSGDISIAKAEAQTARRLDSLVAAYAYPGSVDGLINAFFLTIKSAREAMQQPGIDFPEVEIDRIWMDVLGVADIDIARRFAIEFEMIVNPGWPMPQMMDVLSALRNSGMRLGIISNAQFFTPLLFKVFCGDVPENIGFQAGLVFYSYRHKIAKPSRRLFQLAAAQLKTMGIDAETALYVGNDMLNDIMPAVAEGFQTALFAGDKRSLRMRQTDSRCTGVAPDLIITRLDQLITRIT